MSADEGVEARETVMGPGYPFINPVFEVVPPQLGFLSDPFKDFYFIFIFSSLGKSRNSCILSGTLTEFAIILKEGTFVGRAKGTECAWMYHFSL